MFVESVKKNLKAYGYIATAEDDYIIDVAIEKSQHRIKAFTNLKALPEAINHIIVDMATGEVLQAKNAVGALSNGSGEVRSIQEGDTTVTFASGGAGGDINAVIKKLMNGHFQALIHYRRMP